MSWGRGFVWQNLREIFRHVFDEVGAEGFEALEFLDGAAVEALGLGLVAEKGGVEFGVEASEGFTEEEGSVEGVVGRVGCEGVGKAGDVVALGGDGLIEEAGEDGGFEASDTVEGVLGEGDAFDSVALLGVDGAVDGDCAGDEFGDGLLVFDADNGEGIGAKAVFAGILGGAGFALGGARSGGAGSVGAIGGKLIGGKARCGHGASCYEG